MLSVQGIKPAVGLFFVAVVAGRKRANPLQLGSTVEIPPATGAAAYGFWRKMTPGARLFQPRNEGQCYGVDASNDLSLIHI